MTEAPRSPSPSGTRESSTDQSSLSIFAGENSWAEYSTGYGAGDLSKSLDGPRNIAQLAHPCSVSLSTEDKQTVFFVERAGAVRKIDPLGNVSTIVKGNFDCYFVAEGKYLYFHGKGDSSSGTGGIVRVNTVSREVESFTKQEAVVPTTCPTQYLPYPVFVSPCPKGDSPCIEWRATTCDTVLGPNAFIPGPLDSKGQMLALGGNPLGFHGNPIRIVRVDREGSVSEFPLSPDSLVKLKDRTEYPGCSTDVVPLDGDFDLLPDEMYYRRFAIGANNEFYFIFGNRIGVISEDGSGSILAGYCSGNRDGIGKHAEFGKLTSMSLDSKGNVIAREASWFSSGGTVKTWGNRLRKIGRNGVVVTILEDTILGRDIAVMSDDSILIVDEDGNKIWRFFPS